MHLFVDWRNTAAQRLYEKRGFVLSPRRLMTKLLAE
jgi:predicted GNAT family acetyltransferase